MDTAGGVEAPKNSTSGRADASAPLILAAIDLGSNSIKMTVGRRLPDGRVETILTRSETVRLGAGVDATGRLADDRMTAALDTLTRFADEARAAGAARILGVATEAVRAAENGRAFLERVQRDTGIEVQVISGDAEADLTFRGLAATLDLSGRIVIADAGGASTEIILAQDGNRLWSRSLPLGSGRLTERLIANDPPTAEELAACQAEARRILVEGGVPAGPCDRLIVLGGTGEYLLRLVPSGSPPGPDAIPRLLQLMTTVTSEDLARRLGIPVARARVLPAGIAIVAALAALTPPRVIEGTASGIRLGLLLAAFAGEV